MRFSKTLTTAFSILLIIVWAPLIRNGISAGAPASGTNHALIIGINGYSQWPEMQSPVRDAESITGALIEKYNFKKSNVTLLTDKTPEKPTLVNILTHLDRYSTTLTPKDNLLIFFSGHSTEDDEGETYWIPIDGKKKSKLTWLSHSAITEDVFNSPDFKVKNLCILTDSLFSTKLMRKRPISLTPYDLRYEEKIAEMAARSSRQVISFGDQHWPGSPKTEGLGLFAYYIHKALIENPLDVIDFENLIFEENILFPITKVAGTKLIRGRLKTEMDGGGQFIVKKVTPAPLIDIISAEVDPPKGYPGDQFIILAETSTPASEVIVDISGKKYRMSGNGTHWSYPFRAETLGSTPFRIAALNRNELEGNVQTGEILTIKPKSKVSNVLEAKVAPATGVSGGAFTFSAVTDAPAREVTLVIGEKRLPMKGSGTRWTLTQTVDQEGRLPFSMAAINDDGVPGEPGESTLQIQPGIVNVISISSSPKTGFAGEEYTITAKTDRAAKNVLLEMDGETFNMVGDGRTWRLKRKIPQIGKKQFKAVAVNSLGNKGSALGGELIAKRTPLPIPDVAKVDIAVVSPGKGYAGDKFAIKANTTKPADGVFVDIDGRQYQMKGAGTEWTFVAAIDKVGSSKYRVIARNKDGMRGQSREGEINTRKRPAAPINVRQASISPKRGYIGKEFTFKAVTDRPARTVSLLIAGKPFQMEGSGTQWQLKKPVENSGKLEISMVAINDDGRRGTPYTSELPVYRNRYLLRKDGTIVDVMTGNKMERFKDNGDGTVTDLATSLMWTRTPKQIAMSWDGAADYCRELTMGGHSGWRLPTVNEMKRLTDKTRQNPALPPGHPFSNIITHVGYWTKTRHRFGQNYVYQMSLWYGKEGHLKKTENGIVWPVRYAEIAD